MKKNLFFALAASALVLTACSSKEDEPFGGARPEAHPVEITFDLAVNSGIESRGGRELWSSEALQSVKYVDIYVFGTDGTFKEKLSTKDNTTLTPSGGSDFSDKPGELSTESHTYRFVADLAAGTYTFVGVGYEEDPEQAYTIDAPTATTKIVDMLIKLNENQAAEEVFVGRSIQYTVGAEATSLNASITLNRGVAGILAYFKHIPYKVAVAEGQNEIITRVAVRMVGAASEMKMPTVSNGTTVTAETAKAIEDNIIISFNMKGQSQDGSNNWYAISGWDIEGGQPDGVEKEKNSVLGGVYALPFSRRTEATSYNKATMEVVLFYENESGEEVEAKVYPVYCTQEDTSAGSATKSDKTTKFNILANHFYGLGQKYHNDPKNPTPGTDPDNPDPEPDPDKPTPDDPIDLSAVEYITITVKAAWNTIHHLGFDL